MDTEIERFTALKVTKREAKEKTQQALGLATKARVAGRDSDVVKAEAVIAEQGHATGVEGQCDAEMQAIADTYVTTHADDYTFFEQFIRPDGSPDEQEKAHDALVGMIATFRKAGDVESAAKAEFFELARFPRKKIGSKTNIVYRPFKMGK